MSSLSLSWKGSDKNLMLKNVKAVLRRIGKGLRLGNLAALQLGLGGQIPLGDYLRRVEVLTTPFELQAIQTIPLQQLCPPDLADLYLPLQHISEGASPFADIVVLAVLCHRYKPEKIFEIGTFEGLSACVFALNSSLQTHVYTLDLPHDRDDIERIDRSFSAHSIRKSYRSGFLIDQLIAADAVERLYGDSAVFDFSPWYGSVDLFFVDGAHTEDYVVSDTEKAFRCLRQGGIVVLHDCLVPQVLSVIKHVAGYAPVKYIGDTNVAFSPRIDPQ